MLKYNECKEGDIVLADFEGQMNVGEVLEVNRGNRKARVAQGETEYWYDLHDIHAVPLEEGVLAGLGFTRTGDGTLFERGPFSLRLYPEGGAWQGQLMYRDETRQVHDLKYLHELQNHYRAMTNHGLTWP